MLKSPHPAVDLSFMRPRTRAEGGGIEYWNVQTAGDYSVTGNYTCDSAKGRSLALEYLEYVGEHPTVGNATLLGNIVLDMIAKQAAKGLVLGFMSAVNDYSMTVARIVAGKITTNNALSPSLTRAIEDWRAADTRFSNEMKLDPGHDNDELWQAKEDAETAMLKEPCRSLDDVRAKAEIALRDENVFDSIANCTIGSEHALRIFLRSLLGDERTPVDNGGN
ncbi:hypothetical protein HJC06_10490 [Rhizobium sp. NLR9b]|uniref:hypothetical protein n=1 Tax=unclassified Rhizobium TaxID=2613769 RepID=UPI001C8378C7|nr:MULTISPECIES: hypothetical protein [unclassified Rhizobium]MBX5226852.1 hypothetical protein [Rhizobium sp. NLR9b]MBX5287523.1 hypothetical protein [Rhizobium sp. NLR10b]